MLCAMWIRNMSVRAMWIGWYELHITQYVIRGYVLCDVLREYVIRGYPYITSPRSFRLKVCLRVGNGFAFWN